MIWLLLSCARPSYQVPVAAPRFVTAVEIGNEDCCGVLRGYKIYFDFKGQSMVAELDDTVCHMRGTYLELDSDGVYRPFNKRGEM